MADSASEYQVLARKYRPQTFADLIGQDAMVRTLKNAFSTGRIAHAFMLTGVRGVGKTTTARLIARALNYETDEVQGPSVDLETRGVHCDEIMRSVHPDVIEMDAASRTGIDDMKELLDGVRYAPLSARYRVYILDEIHMLSAKAFNALLKTLEEPPAHAKFIFATTEIRKVPVTVLSRCQRFDLKRIEPDVLEAHLAGVCAKEGATVDADGLKLIVRAAEGSVRDALSILDQAIVQAETGGVTAAEIRDMLGLADRARTFDLFEAALTGDRARALSELKSQHDAGADSVTVMRDLLDHCHDVTRAKALGEQAGFTDAADHIARVRACAEDASMAELTRVWQMLLKAHDETRLAPDPLAAAEMAILRIAVAAELPSPEEAARILSGRSAGAEPVSSDNEQSGSGGGGGGRAKSAARSGGGAAAAPRPQDEPDDAPEPEIEDAAEDAPSAHHDGEALFQSIADVAARAEAERDFLLKSDVERFVRPVSFEQGKIVYQPADGAPVNLGQTLSAALQDWTGARWLVMADKNAKGGETLSETRMRERRELFEQAAQSDAVKAALELWPGAEIADVRVQRKPVEGEDEA